VAIEPDLDLIPGIRRARCCQAFSNQIADAIEELCLDGEWLDIITQIADPHIDPELGVAIGPVEIGVDLEVADVEIVPRVEGDIAEDAADAPEVLALEIGAVRVTVDLERDHVLARHQIPGPWLYPTSWPLTHR